MSQLARRLSPSFPARTIALATVLLVAAGGSVASAAQPKPGALYTGTEPGCTAHQGFTCAFLFRVSSTGRSMTFAAAHNVVGAWACKGGGGEAVLGPYTTPLQGQPVPKLTIETSGAFTGKQSFGSGQARGSVVASGRFTGTGATATITFTLNPGPHACANGPVALSLS